MLGAVRVDVLGVQMDLGAGLRGVDMVSAVRYADLLPRLTQLGLEVRDRGNVVASVPRTVDAGGRDLRYGQEVAACCAEVARRVGESLAVGALPLLLGGDHSLSIGSIAAARAARPEVRVLWLDAHGDLNTPTTSPSGNVHGMALAVALGQVACHFEACGWPERALAPERLALVGVRSLDPGERELVARLGLPVLTVADVDRMGIHATVSTALDRLGALPGSLWVSVDLDVLDPLHAPGVGTPVPGGLTVREAHLALELVAASGQLAGLELVEINPIWDVANQTAELARDLALSALGQRIL